MQKFKFERERERQKERERGRREQIHTYFHPKVVLQQAQ